MFFVLGYELVLGVEGLYVCDFLFDDCVCEGVEYFVVVSEVEVGVVVC